jgi:hypothetical protein
MTASPATGSVDFAIHGLVTVRLVDPSPGTVAAFSRRWGPAIDESPGSEPDIVIRSGPNLDPGELKYIGLKFAGTSGNDFYVLDRVSGTPVVRIPFEDVGDRCELVAGRDLKSLPLLTDIINYRFLAKGFIPLHASAVSHRGVGVLAMGWPKGGKTGVMLAFLNHGATFVGDEWILLSDDGDTALGLPVPIGVSEWQLEHVPNLIPSVGVQKRSVFTSIHLLESLHGTLERSRFSGSAPAKLLRKGLPGLRSQLKITKSHSALVGVKIGELRTSVDVIFLLIAHSDPEILVERCDAEDVTRRMVNATMHEQRDFFAYYRAFKFGFPDRSNQMLEHAEDHLRSRLRGALATKRTHVVSHPYGGPLEDLFRALEPHCSRPPSD